MGELDKLIEHGDNFTRQTWVEMNMKIMKSTTIIEVVLERQL
jgi:hypothetical protein